MWGAFLSEPLRIAGSVVRYTADYLMRRMPIPVRLTSFLPRGCPRGIYAGLARLSPGCPPDRGRLHTCYSPVRRSPAEEAETSPLLPLDLHVLSLPLAFILSQDQTLRCMYIDFSIFSVCLSSWPDCADALRLRPLIYIVSGLDETHVPCTSQIPLTQ